jgi:UDP-galactopyranose mutase
MIDQLYGLRLSALEMSKFLDSRAEPVAQILTSEDVVVSKIGRALYEKFFRGYTRKHWGLDPSELDAQVTARIPVRTNRDDRYFTDCYQVMPKHGFTRMFDKMLDHPNIKILLNTDYREIKELVPYREMIYTGPIDEFFDYRHGKLPYRSLAFKHETLNQARFQPVTAVNYPNEFAYTHVTEFRHLTGQEHTKTSIVYEFPKGEGDPYYPIPRPENTEIYRRYQALAQQRSDVQFVGRLATYKDLDIIGLNFYPNNERIYQGRALRPGHQLYRPLRELLLEVHHRYTRPLLIAETGTEGRRRAPWLRYVCEEVRAAMDAGVPLHGICLYPIVNHPGWNNHPHDSRGVLSYLRDNRRAYGYLINARAEGELRRQILDRCVNGQLRLRCGVPADAQVRGGLTVYGAQSGRYPICPTIIAEW